LLESFCKTNNQVNNQVATKWQPSNNHNLDNRYKNKRQQQGAAAPDPAVVVFSILKNIGLTTEEEIEITKRFAHDEQSVINAVAQANKRKSKIDNLAGYIITVALKKPQAPLTPAQQKEINHSVAMGFRNKCSKQACATFEVLSSGWEINFGASPKPAIVGKYEQDPAKFAQELQNMLEQNFLISCNGLNGKQR
jgi:hypothetical protein